MMLNAALQAPPSSLMATSLSSLAGSKVMTPASSAPTWLSSIWL
jgi:hypothetical protein